MKRFKLSYKTLILVAAFFVAMAATVPATAADLLPKAQCRELVQRIASGYSDWKVAELNGKVLGLGLPVNPSVKIYMEKGIFLAVSARAPFVGEAGRIEIDADSLLVVNKMKRVYAKEPVSCMQDFCPVGLEDLQTLLLARIAVMGKGQLFPSGWKDVYVYCGDDGYVVVPLEKYQPEGAEYGYMVDADGKLMSMASTLGSPDTFMSMGYNFSDGIDIALQFVSPKRSMGATLDLDNPKWNGKAPDRFTPTSRFRRVGLREVLKF